jgi:transposase-like protein
MAQPFCQSKAYRDLSQWDFTDLTEDQAREKFIIFRWGSTTVMPCPICGTVDKHYPRRTRKQWRCKHCDAIFSVTTKTPFSGRKIPFKRLLILIYEFISAPDGCAANRLHSRMELTLRAAYQNLSKLREVLWETRDQAMLKGLVQVDGGHFCGKPRRPNKRAKITSTIVNSKLRNRKAGMVPDKSVTHAEPWNIEKLKNRRIVLALRELHMPTNSGLGARRTISVILKNEHAASVEPVIRKFVDPGAEIWTDCGTGFSQLSRYFDHDAVNHSIEYMREDGVNNNQAESYFGRMRRGEYGVYHGMRPQYLAFYANEFAWREDVRTMTLSQKFNDMMKKIFKCGRSEAWFRYAQGDRLGFEYLG